MPSPEEQVSQRYRQEPPRWMLLMVSSDELQLYPRQDLIAHELVEDSCVCGPSVELHKRPGMSDVHLYRHHALDGRAPSD